MELPFYGFDGTLHYEFQWYFGATQPKRNTNGTSGWATVISRSCGTVPDMPTIRVHLCAHNPCAAVFPDYTYPMGPPLHVQQTAWRPPAPLAGAPGPGAADVGEPPPPPPPAPPPPLDAAAPHPPEAPAHAAVAAAVAAVAAAPPSFLDAAASHPPEAPAHAAVAAASHPSVLPPPPQPPSLSPKGALEESPPLPPPEKPLPEFPAPPAPHPVPATPLSAPLGAPLQRMCAAAPVAAAFGYAIPSPAVAASAHSAAVAASPELAKARISNRLLQLARDIRRPRTYVGHSAFICFALCRGCRPFIWEGASRVDIVKAYVPWALGRCKHECIVDGVCCCFERVAGSAVAEMKPVSETHPLSRCTHFVAAVRMACGLGGPYPDSLVGFYSSHGFAVLGTVADGDCGMDVCCQMLGLP